MNVAHVLVPGTYSNMLHVHFDFKKKKSCDLKAFNNVKIDYEFVLRASFFFLYDIRKRSQIGSLAMYRDDGVFDMPNNTL